MEADYIIAYPQGETAELLVESFIDKGHSIAVLSPSAHQDKKKRKHHIPWNPKSPLSAKNALLTVSHACTKIPPLVVVFPDLDQSGMSSHQLSFAQIDAWIDNALRGMIFLLKELIIMRKQGITTLVLCLPRQPQQSNAVITTLYTSMRELGEQIFLEYADSGISLYGFENKYDDPNRFADFILHHLPQLSKKQEGRWNTAGDRGIFFSNRKK
ncbi:MAG: hypothetical protein JXB03_03670 [Spirochaetales bacterium]|nr:hypothetical protein [Spirochaetales bacterium]